MIRILNMHIYFGFKADDEDFIVVNKYGVQWRNTQKKRLNTTYLWKMVRSIHGYEVSKFARDNQMPFMTRIFQRNNKNFKTGKKIFEK